MFLSLDIFLAHFPLFSMSREEFTQRFTVMYATPQSLADIFALRPTGRGKANSALIKKPETDKRYIHREEVIDYFYDMIITHRHHFLSKFYEAYFQFKDPRDLDWGNSHKLLSYPPAFAPHPVVSLQKNDASRRIIRNLFYLELLDLTRITNTVKHQVSFWQSLVNMYNKLELEDRFFAPSCVDLFLRDKTTKKAQSSVDRMETINYHNLFYCFQAYQPKASIFNPYSINWILKNLIINKMTKSQALKIFTPVLSWGSYLVATMHEPRISEYVGVDVMPSVCKKVDFLAKWYAGLGKQYKKEVSIYCQPSESLSKDFLNKYRNYFDIIMVCPPYYDMEVYHEGEQSIETYKTYQTWLKGYWYQTVEICHQVLNKGGIIALIANNYNSLKGDHHPLVDDLNQPLVEKFQFLEMYYLQNRTSPLRVNAKDRTERLFLYRRT
jgi:hypothetical protein